MTELIDFGWKVNEGKAPAKVANHDALVEIMREILRANEGIQPAAAVAEWKLRVRGPELAGELVESALDYAGHLLFRRCAVPVVPAPQHNNFRQRVRQAVAANIQLSTWIVPGVGKALCDCTFAEAAQAASINGSFLRRLAGIGKPDQRIGDVLDEESLQTFFKEGQ